MNKILLAILICLLLISSAFGEPVSPEKAKQVGLNWMWKHKILQSLAQDRVKILSKGRDVRIKRHEDLKYKDRNIGHLIHIDPNGFVIVSVDDALQPVLAYSLENDFDTANIPPALECWLGDVNDYVSYERKHPNRKVNQKAGTEWKRLNAISANFDTTLPSDQQILKESTGQVGPLVTTQWGQGAYYSPYNKYCPGLPFEAILEGEDSSYFTKNGWNTLGDMPWTIEETLKKH